MIALFVSLGGVGYGAAKVGSSQIKGNSVASKDIKNSGIALKDLSGKTRSGLRGARGPAGAAGQIGPAGPAGRSALSSLSRGERIYGTYALQGPDPSTWTGVTFPVPAPTPVDSFHVVIAGNDTVTGAGCSGSTANPVSAPGFVCIYPNISAGSTSAFGWGARCACSNPAATGDGSRFGFMVQVNGPGVMPSGLITTNGVWAYTAP